jgi:all-trans-retinol 13,14-reductase
MHTGECVTFVDWDNFAQWQHTEFGDREPDYEALKKNIEERMLMELKLRLPNIMQHLEFCELSTPLTAAHYARASQGAIYGLSASPQRFTCEPLRVRTPIKNFFMGGVDVATLGVISGMTSGILAATAIDKRAYLRLLGW